MKITITGIDESVNIKLLLELRNTFQFAEFGFLYSESNIAKRYPSLDFIKKTASKIGERCALHLCGRGAINQFADKKLVYVTSLFDRVQINGGVSREAAIPAAERLFPAIMITQHNERNMSLIDLDVRNHALLVDSSGGRGISPDEWLLPPTRKSVGFAGGLGPDNLHDELCRIVKTMNPQRLNESDWWVDMESKLRDKDDWFCFSTAHEVLEIFHNFVESPFIKPTGETT